MEFAEKRFIAYNECSPNPWKTFDGRDVPRWGDVTKQVREKWRAAALAAMLSPRLELEDIAAAAHEVNRAYCESLGDTSQKTWANAPEWQKDSGRKGVLHHIANPLSTPADSHESWLQEKRAAGWTWGAVKDPETKQHPCFVPYEQLPTEQRAKDFLFRGTVRALLVHAIDVIDASTTPVLAQFAGEPEGGLPEHAPLERT